MGGGISFNRSRPRSDTGTAQQQVDSQVQTSAPLPVLDNATESNEIITAGGSRGSRGEAVENGPSFSPPRFSSAGNLLNSNSNQSSPLRNRSSRSSPNMQQPSSGGTRESRGDRESVDMMFRRAAVIANTVSSDGSENSAIDTFAHTALSLGMDSEDLLFNMMFFDDGTVPNFGNLVNTLQQETLALHSENNTPYKLNPAKDSVIAGLKIEKFHVSAVDYETECAVCKDDIDEEAEILRVPHCGHYFHLECLMKWIHLQAWCPVCRANLEHDTATQKKSPRSSGGVMYPPTIKEDNKLGLSDEDIVEEQLQATRVAKRLNFDSFIDSMMSADSLADEKGATSHRSAADDKKGVDYKACAKGDFDLMEDSYQSSSDYHPHYKSPESSAAEESTEGIIAAAMVRAMLRETPAAALSDENIPNT